MEFFRLVKAIMKVEKSLAEKAQEEGDRIRIDRTAGKQESKNFVPGVLGGRITKSSSGKQKGGRVDQPGELVASVNKRP